jgi:hypothetical protein
MGERSFDTETPFDELRAGGDAGKKSRGAWVRRRMGAWERGRTGRFDVQRSTSNVQREKAVLSSEFRVRSSEVKTVAIALVRRSWSAGVSEGGRGGETIEGDAAIPIP